MGTCACTNSTAVHPLPQKAVAPIVESGSAVRTGYVVSHPSDVRTIRRRVQSGQAEAHEKERHNAALARFGYVLLELIGRGNQGSVWLSSGPDPSIAIAVKYIRGRPSGKIPNEVKALQLLSQAAEKSDEPPCPSLPRIQRIVSVSGDSDVDSRSPSASLGGQRHSASISGQRHYAILHYSPGLDLFDAIRNAQDLRSKGLRNKPRRIGAPASTASSFLRDVSVSHDTNSEQAEDLTHPMRDPYSFSARASSSARRAPDDSSYVFDEPTVAHVIRGLLVALRWMHRHGFIHCDVKLENVVWDSVSGSVKLTDFGHTLRCPRDQTVVPCAEGTGGTVYYRSPEAIKGLFGRHADVWGVGVIMFAMLFGRMPFRSRVSGTAAEYEAVRHGLILDIHLADIYCSPVAGDLMSRLLHGDYEQRITVDEALEHPFCNSLTEQEDGVFVH